MSFVKAAPVAFVFAPFPNTHTLSHNRWRKKRKNRPLLQRFISFLPSRLFYWPLKTAFLDIVSGNGSKHKACLQTGLFLPSTVKSGVPLYQIVSFLRRECWRFRNFELTFLISLHHSTEFKVPEMSHQKIFWFSLAKLSTLTLGMNLNCHGSIEFR